MCFFFGKVKKNSSGLSLNLQNEVLEVEPASEPSDICWENLYTDKWQRNKNYIKVTISLLVVFAGIFVLFTALKNKA